MRRWADAKKELQSISASENVGFDLTAKMISQFIRRRKQLELTQRELGERSGLQQAYIARVENGQTTPRLDTLMRLVTALELELALIPFEVRPGTEEAVAAVN